MTSFRPKSPTWSRVFPSLVLGIALFLLLLVANTFRSDSQDRAAVGLSTASLFSVGADIEPTTAAEPTTPPLQIPTATPEPTGTPQPAPTAIPTVAPTVVPPAPTPVPPPPPPPTAVPQEPSEVSVASGSSTTVTETDPAPVPAQDPTATPEVEAFVVPTETSLAEPTAAPEPTDVPLPPRSTNTAELESYVLGEINRIRTKAGLGPLALDTSVSVISRDWSQQMATAGFFSHRPGPELSALLPAGWRRWGENIASAPDIFWAQTSLERSPEHYENMVGPFTHVGIGVFSTGGQVWVTQNFVQY